MTDPEASTEQLLAALNRWEREHGPLGGGRDLASTGEAPARIEALKAELLARGVAVRWTGDAYVPVAADDRP